MNQKALIKKVTKPITKMKAIINSSSVQEQFKNALGKHSDLFVASLIDVYRDGLQKYEPGAVIEEALKAAVLRLPISKNLGLAYIVPYKGKPTFQVGYKGLIQLAMRTGQVKTINAGPVYEGEFNRHDRLTGELDIYGERESDKVIGYFCYLGLMNGFSKADYWTKEKVIKHAEDKSPSYGNRKSAWFTDFDAMATKTVISAVFGKYAPKSIEFIAAIEQDSDESRIAKAKDIDLTGEDLTSEPKKTTPRLEAPAKENQPPKGSDEEFFGNMPEEPDFGA